MPNNLSLNIDAEIGKMAQRKSELDSLANQPPPKASELQIRNWIESIAEEATHLKVLMDLLKARKALVKASSVVVEQLGAEELQKTKDALAALDKEVKRDQAVNGLVDLLKAIKDAADLVALRAATGRAA